MNILFISALYPPTTKGGGELSTHYIAQGLAARGHRVKVVTVGPQRVESHINGVDVLRFPLELLQKPLFEKAASRRVSHHLLDIIGNPTRYDIIHAHDFRSALALSQLALPQAVVTARDYAQISGCTNNILGNGSIDPGCAEHPLGCHRVAEASLARKPFRLWQYTHNLPFRKEAFTSFAKQIFISRAQESAIKKYLPIPQQKTTVIYNPVPLDYLSEPIAKNGTNNVLYVGRVEMYKGVKVLLEAWRKISVLKPQLHLHIVGEGAQQKEYERLIDIWGLQYKVTLRGKIPAERMRAMYDNADIVVAPHLWLEPFGRTTVEGMARGKIVVASNCGGPAEIITDKKTGLLFQRGSVEDLTKKILEAYSMNHFDKQEMVQAARSWVQNNVSTTEIARQHEVFYAS